MGGKVPHMSTPLNSGPAFALHLNRREKKPRALARDESWSTAVERRRPVRELLTEAVSAQPPLPEAGLGRCCGPPDRTPPPEVWVTHLTHDHHDHRYQESAV